MPVFASKLRARVTRSTLATCRRALLVGVCALGACKSEPRRERLQHGRFDSVELRVPDAPRGVVLLLSSAEDAALAEDASAIATRQGALVVRVDASDFARLLNETQGGCVFASGDLDNLAHFVEAYLKLPSYEPAVLLGVGLGAQLARAALDQAPADTFAGAILIGACPGSGLRVPLCPGQPDVLAPEGGEAGLALGGERASCTSSADGAGSAGNAAGAAGASDDPGAREALAALPAALTQLAVVGRSRATAAPGDMRDLPLTEVVAAGGDHPDTFGILLSGDGGWAGIDKALSARLARRGLPIVGIDSLRYFWSARTPEGTAADLDRVIRRYQRAWKRRRVVLMGYSQGADVLPFILNRLPDDTRRDIVSAVALSLSTTATFEFHLSNWIGASGDRPTLPEVQRLGHSPLVCVYGQDDPDALCPALQPDAYRIVALPGDHHFNADYDRLTTIVLDSVPPG